MAGKANIPIWDNDKNWAPPAPLKSDTICDVCVIGLGGSGLSAINELIKNNVKVIGVDKHDVGAGAAGRNGGFLLAGLAEFYHDAVKNFGNEFALKTYQETLKELDHVF